MACTDDRMKIRLMLRLAWEHVQKNKSQHEAISLGSTNARVQKRLKVRFYLAICAKE